MHNKNSNIQERSPNVVKVNFLAIRNCSKRKEFAPSGSKFFPLREVPILKKDAIDPFHIVIFLSNRSSIEKLIEPFLKMKGLIAY